MERVLSPALLHALLKQHTYKIQAERDARTDQCSQNRTIGLAFIELNNFKSSFKILQWLPITLKMKPNALLGLDNSARLGLSPHPLGLRALGGFLCLSKNTLLSPTVRPLHTVPLLQTPVTPAPVPTPHCISDASSSRKSSSNFSV